jgi:hypothetical protein
MDKLRNFFWPPKASYDPLDRQDDQDLDEDPLMGHSAADIGSIREAEAPFRGIYYGIFMLLGVAMLWAW